MLRTVFLTCLVAAISGLATGQTLTATGGWAADNPAFGVRASVEIGSAGQFAASAGLTPEATVGVDASLRRTWFTGASSSLDTWWHSGLHPGTGLQASGLHATTRVGPVYLAAERSWTQNLQALPQAYGTRPAGVSGPYDLLEMRFRGRPEVLSTVRVERFLDTHAITVPLAAPRLWSRDTTALAATTLRLQPHGRSEIGIAWGLETNRRRGPSARGRQWWLVRETASDRAFEPGFDAELAFDAADGRTVVQASTAGTPTSPTMGRLAFSYERNSATSTFVMLGDGSMHLTFEVRLGLASPSAPAW